MSALLAVRKGCIVTANQLPLLAAVSASCVRYSTETCMPVVAAKLPCRVKVTGGKRYVWCACGHSNKQPYCDGAHRTKAPSILPIRFTPDKDRTLLLCACKQTKNAPYCDGTHFKVIITDLIKSVKKVLQF